MFWIVFHVFFSPFSFDESSLAKFCRSGRSLTAEEKEAEKAQHAQCFIHVRRVTGNSVQKKARLQTLVNNFAKKAWFPTFDFRSFRCIQILDKVETCDSFP